MMGKFVMSGFKKQDEYYTPERPVELIAKYLKSESVIWCPFDTQESNFVRVLKREGHKVIATCIKDGKDFFKGKPKQKIDYIISNPPYSRKTEVIERCFELQIPFAMLVGVLGLFEGKKADMFCSHNFEIMYISPRIKYLLEDCSETAAPPYQSVYICSGVLPEKIIFENLKKCVDK